MQRITRFSKSSAGQGLMRQVQTRLSGGKGSAKAGGRRRARTTRSRRR
jgi:hypothetical protein